MASRNCWREDTQFLVNPLLSPQTPTANSTYRMVVGVRYRIRGSFALPASEPEVYRTVTCSAARPRQVRQNPRACFQEISSSVVGSGLVEELIGSDEIFADGQERQAILQFRHPAFQTARIRLAL